MKKCFLNTNSSKHRLTPYLLSFKNSQKAGSFTPTMVNIKNGTKMMENN